MACWTFAKKPRQFCPNRHISVNEYSNMNRNNMLFLHCVNHKQYFLNECMCSLKMSSFFCVRLSFLVPVTNSSNVVDLSILTQAAVNPQAALDMNECLEEEIQMRMRLNKTRTKSNAVRERRKSSQVKSKTH